MKKPCEGRIRCVDFYCTRRRLGGIAAARSAGLSRREADFSSGNNQPKNYQMAFTPSKDHKRREREQKKLDKRIAREEEKAERLAEKQAEEDAAEAEAGRIGCNVARGG
jgi:hypothetical protein